MSSNLGNCGGKSSSVNGGPWHPCGAQPRQEVKTWPEDFQPNPVELGRACLKRRTRRNVSSDASNRNPTCALHIVGNHPRPKEILDAQGGNHNCRIKCKETTFPAALMWRGQENNITLASATHRKGG